MLKKTLSVVVVGAALCVSSLSMACDQTDLAKSMKEMKVHTQSLVEHLKSGEVDSARQDVASVLSELKVSKTQTPYKVLIDELEGNEFKQAMAEYNNLLDQSIDAYTAVDEHLKDGDIEGARAALKDVSALRKQGHNEFKVDC